MRSTGTAGSCFDTQPTAGIEAEVLVVASFEELQKRADEVKGRIVLYNEPYVSYGDTVQYRALGATEAAKLGALATLVRSITPFSISRSAVCTALCSIPYPFNLW